MLVSTERTTEKQTRLKRGGVIALSVLWLAGVTAGFTALAVYKSTASEVSSDAPDRFPADSIITRAEGSPTLLMFIHPRCACSRASLAELSKLLQELHGSVFASIVVRSDAPVGATPETTDITSTASAVSGATVLADHGGSEAARFGATSSGHTVVYDRDGRLIFSGGLTNSRGHEGESLGKAHLLSALKTKAEGARAAAVYGCKLEDGEPTP